MLWRCRVLSRGRTQSSAKFSLNRKTADGEVSECSERELLVTQRTPPSEAHPAGVCVAIYLHVTGSGQCS